MYELARPTVHQPAQSNISPPTYLFQTIPLEEICRVACQASAWELWLPVGDGLDQVNSRGMTPAMTAASTGNTILLRQLVGDLMVVVIFRARITHCLKSD